MELETACEKITEEVMQNLAFLFGEKDLMFEENRHKIISEGISMALGVGYNEGMKSIKRNNRRKVIQLDIMDKSLKLWDSVTDAMRGTGIDRSQIIKVARGRKGFKTAGGFKWKYANQ